MPNPAFNPDVTLTPDSSVSLFVAPAQVIRGRQILAAAAEIISSLGQRPLVMGGNHALSTAQPGLDLALQSLDWVQVPAGQHCSEGELQQLRQAVIKHQADLVIGVGGGKVLDAAKLVAHQCQVPVISIPTSGATCAAWSALSNVYSDSGAFEYDVSLGACPNLLILDYALIQTAPMRTLIAGIGDALAKWYEAAASSGNADQTLTIAAVQQARVLRDILLQKSISALTEPGGSHWQEVVDATVLLAGVIGGLGGAQCRTVAAHAVHNGLTHLRGSQASLHGEKVAYGILVQLRLEEMLQGNNLAAAARQQLLKFYAEIGLPATLADLKLAEITLQELEVAAEIACAPGSDLHQLPFAVSPVQLMAAMVSTAAPVTSSREGSLANGVGE